MRVFFCRNVLPTLYSTLFLRGSPLATTFQLGAKLPQSLIKLALALLTLLTAFASASLHAQLEAGITPEIWLDRLEAIDESLENDDLAQSQLTTYRSQIEAMSTDSAKCVESIKPLVDQLRQQIDVIADLGPETDAALFDRSIEIQSRYNDAQTQYLSCLQVVDRTGVMEETVSTMLGQLAARFLWQRNAALPTLLANAAEQISGWPDLIRGGMLPQTGEDLTIVQLLWLLIIAGILAISLGVYIRFRFYRWYHANGFADREPELRVLLPKPLAMHAPLLLLGLVLLFTLYVTAANASLDLAAVRVAYGIFLYGIGCVVIDWATGPLSPSAQVPGFYPTHVVPVRLRLRIFILTLVGSYVVLGRAWLAASQGQVFDPLTRMLMIVALACALGWTILYLRRVRGLSRYRFVGVLGLTALAVALIAAGLGYQNFASYVTHGTVRTASAIIVVWILLWLVFALFESVIEGRTESARRVRDMIASSESESRTGFGLIQLSADVIIWVVFAIYLVYVWDSSGVTLEELRSLAVEGSQIGEIKLVPLQIIEGVAIFALLVALTGWIKHLIDKRWLRHMNMDRGARDAMVTLSGYIGFVVAILVALTVAGIDLGGLALVGGALALGIGFGLQAIASNFVSGLILLFERPIKAGDFVTVGDTEGFVRRIRIRATDIETLDNQNVLVPNSELVSGRVTNWVLRNPQGRLRIQVGVAYGSDVELVRNLLQQVGRDHEDVISDGGAPAPRALFMGFGDSSLDFELRVRIRRIEKRYTVISDINFEIDKAFRENNIAIPFPQRDLHLISLPEQQIAAPLPEAPAARTKRAKPEPPIDEITRRFEQKVRLKCSIEHAWTALTDEEQLQRWFAREVDIAARIGGQFKAELHDGSAVDAIIDVFMPPRRLRLAQRTPDGEGPLPSGPVIEELVLTQDKEAVVLRVTVSGIPADEDWEGFYRRTEAHWETSLGELKKLLRVVKDS